MAASRLLVARLASSLAVGAIAVSCLPSVARADDRDPAGAEAIFEAGKAALEQNDLPTACAKFAESERLDPAPGTLFFWADCEEKRGKLATSWALFRELEQKLPDSDARKPGVVERRGALDPRLPRLTILLDPKAPKGAKVKRDDTPTSTGTPLPVDPGPHVVTVEADGFAPGTSAITLAEAESKEITVSVGKAAPTAKVAPPAQSGDHRGLSGRVAAGITVGSIGIAAMGAGIAVGIVAKSHYDDSKGHCNSKDQCDKRGIDIRNSARTEGNVATAVFFVGAAATVTGAVVWLTAPRADGGLVGKANPIQIGLGPTSIALRGSWSKGP